MKRLLSFFLAFLAFAQCTFSCFASDDVTQIPETDAPTSGAELDLNVGAAVLMEAKTGKVLYATNENEALPRFCDKNNDAFARYGSHRKF